MLPRYAVFTACKNTTKMENKNVIQSYLFSRIRSRMSITEMRILMRIVEFAQCELQGLVLRKNMQKIEHELGGKVVQLAIKSVLPPGSHHYEDVYTAVKSLMGKIVERYQPDRSSWQAATMVTAAKSEKNTGLISLSISPWVWDCILDFTKGFVRYDLAAAMSIKSPYALKLYFLMSYQRSPITYSFNELYRLFGITDKYGRTNDFVRKVLIPAKRELDLKSPWSCDIRPMKDGRKLLNCMFYPYEQKDKYSEGVQERSLSGSMPTLIANHQLYQYLRYNIGFEANEIGAHKRLLSDFAVYHEDPLGFVAELRARALKQGDNKGKGWYIAAIKSELNNIGH